MPKDKFKTVYVCMNCGESAPRWMGRCPACGAWNTMVEDVVREEKPAKASGGEKALPAALALAARPWRAP